MKVANLIKQAERFNFQYEINSGMVTFALDKNWIIFRKRRGRTDVGWSRYHLDDKVNFFRFSNDCTASYHNVSFIKRYTNEFPIREKSEWITVKKIPTYLSVKLFWIIEENAVDSQIKAGIWLGLGKGYIGGKSPDLVLVEMVKDFIVTGKDEGIILDYIQEKELNGLSKLVNALR